MKTTATKLYPLLFEPLYKQKVWGGSYFTSVLGRNVDIPDSGDIGESWELYDDENVSSRITNGALAGSNLHDLLEHSGREIVGKDFEGGLFPVMVKLLDAKNRLSLQVHPDACAAEAIGDGAREKNELWYIIRATPQAEIIAGLKPEVTDEKQLHELQQQGRLEELVQRIGVKPGDVYFIPAGTIHSVGAGIQLLEIQQNSNTTFRLYDWERRDALGRLRKLQVKDAVRSARFSVCPKNFPRPENINDFSLPFCHAETIPLNEKIYSTTSAASFHLLVSIRKPFLIEWNSRITAVPWGTPCLLPACLGEYCIYSEESDNAVIRITLP